MSSKTIELHLFGQVLRLSCPEEQHQELRDAADILEQRVAEMKERTGMIQLEKALSIVALNLTFELLQEKAKTQTVVDKLQNSLHSLNSTLEKTVIKIPQIMSD